MADSTALTQPNGSSTKTDQPKVHVRREKLVPTAYQNRCHWVLDIVFDEGRLPRAARSRCPELALLRRSMRNLIRAGHVQGDGLGLATAAGLEPLWPKKRLKSWIRRPDSLKGLGWDRWF